MIHPNDEGMKTTTAYCEERMSAPKMIKWMIQSFRSRELESVVLLESNLDKGKYMWDV